MMDFTVNFRKEGQFSAYLAVQDFLQLVGVAAENYGCNKNCQVSVHQPFGYVPCRVIYYAFPGSFNPAAKTAQAIGYLDFAQLKKGSLGS
jgi:hypothetical protein